MGFRISDITPFSPMGATVLVPTSKDVVAKAFKVARSETASVKKVVLPADASILEVVVYGSTACLLYTSDAADE